MVLCSMQQDGWRQLEETSAFVLLVFAGMQTKALLQELLL